MPQPCTVRCLWAGFSPRAAGSACGVCVSLYVCYVVSMDLCGFHETCVACPCSVESRLIECCDRHGRLSGASRAGLAGAAQRVCAHSPQWCWRSLRATRGARPKRHDAEVHRCSAAEPQSCAATLYNAPHAAIRLIRQGFGRERGHCAKAAWRAACSCWRLLLRRPRGFLHWSPRASCFRTHGSRRTDMAMALRSSTRPRPRAC